MTTRLTVSDSRASAPEQKEGRYPMTSQAIRDPITDPLLTPANSALIMIDYQPVQVSSVLSMDHALLVDNIVRVAKTARV